jgi:hypothetical protein
MAKTKINPKVAELLDQFASGSSKKVNKTFSLDAEAYKELEQLCSEREVPVSRIVNELIVRFLRGEGK